MSTLNGDNDSSDNALSSDGEYDLGRPDKPDAFETVEVGTATTSDTTDAEIAQDPLVEEATGQSQSEIDGDDETEFLDIEDPLDDGATGQSHSEIDGDGGDGHVNFLDIQSVEESSTLVKEEPFNLAMMQISLDNSNNSNNSDVSDCIITTAYYLYDDVDDTDAK